MEIPPFGGLLEIPHVLNRQGGGSKKCSGPMWVSMLPLFALFISEMKGNI